MFHFNIKANFVCFVADAKEKKMFKCQFCKKRNFSQKKHLTYHQKHECGENKVRKKI